MSVIFASQLISNNSDKDEQLIIVSEKYVTQKPSLPCVYPMSAWTIALLMYKVQSIV